MKNMLNKKVRERVTDQGTPKLLTFEFEITIYDKSGDDVSTIVLDGVMTDA